MNGHNTKFKLDTGASGTGICSSEQPCSLLSKNVCVQFGLVKLNDVGEVIQSPPDFRKEFPRLFEGLGKLKTKHHITLRDDATPVCLYNPRKVPHPLLPKVEAELQSILNAIMLPALYQKQRSGTQS